eukprot:TRINITY_DN113982_c0_g1_i1.p1 TRINITY_DN113982_c0_g1~~TRINITY_DN113982_c0_g1_i1.p1  ORF type:complete len:412 (+),score=37.76 TRINITY_DN113982_c0_g1_i1:27-1238(+)
MFTLLWARCTCDIHHMRVASVAAAGEHTLLTTGSGDIITVGACAAGWKYDVPYCDETLRLTAARCRRLLPGFGQGLPQVAAGSFHNLVIQSGKLFSWGCDSIDENDGQLGLSTRTEVSVPTPVALSEGVVDAAAGAHHSLALTMSGAVLSAGAGLLGQLGRKHNYSSGETCDDSLCAHDTFLPVEVPVSPGEVVKRVSCGYYHSLCITSCGRLFAFGSNNHGQCGSCEPITAQEKSDCSESHFVRPKLVRDLDGQHVTQAAGGYGHTVALSASGDVWTCGSNSHGQRGIPDTETLSRCCRVEVGGPAVAVAAGYSHSVVLRRDGGVMTFGENDCGQLGIHGDSRDVPSLVPLSHRCVGIAAGNSHTVALREDGVALTWGSGRNGQHGIPCMADLPSPMVMTPF